MERWVSLALWLMMSFLFSIDRLVVMICCSRSCLLNENIKFSNRCWRFARFAVTLDNVAISLASSTSCSCNFATWSSTWFNCYVKRLSMKSRQRAICDNQQRAVCDNPHRAICPGAWQVQWFQWFQQDGATPPLLKRIIGMATAAFPWPTDQPQVWPAVVTAFTGLEPPKFLYTGKFCVNLNKILDVIRFLVMTVFFVSP